MSGSSKSRTRATWSAAAGALVVTLVATGAVADLTPVAKAATAPSSYVDPFIGTGSGSHHAGHTFPGAAEPFGMVQWSPDTSPSNAGGYKYASSSITGFSLTHLSGAGCNRHPPMRDISFMPVVGPVTTSPSSTPRAYWASFSHRGESAAPGYYHVHLGSGVDADISATTRSGIGRFGFPSSQTSSILITPGSAGFVQDASVDVVAPDEIVGSATAGHFCGHDNTYTVYFAARFDMPFSTYGTWNGGAVVPESTDASGSQSGAYATFDTSAHPQVQVKVGLSYVSSANALANLRAEDPGWDFDAVRSDAGAAWDDELGRIQVSGGSDEQTTVFYTALYHCLLHPNVFSDVNGDYMGFDGRIHNSGDHVQYANFSGWDIYRSEIQLIALLEPGIASDMARSLVADAAQGGDLPRWPLASSDTEVSIGDSSAPIISSAYAFGATGFPVGQALDTMIRGARSASERPSIGEYLHKGYVTLDSPGGDNGAAATTLEYATDDFSIAQLAEAHGRHAVANAFMRTAQNWQNLFHGRHRFIEPRRADYEWDANFSPSSPTGFREGNGAQYTWMIPFNLGALFNAMGGPDRASRRLSSFFSEFNASFSSPYAAMGNEVTLGAPWAFDASGKPWRTQALTQQIGDRLYAATPNGLPGDDDLGELSSWYVWSSLGLYPAIPGTSILAVGTPRFPDATIAAGGRRFEIRASGGFPYIKSLSLNGSPYPKTYFDQQHLSDGSLLQFDLGGVPNRSWGTGRTDALPSFSRGEAPGIAYVTQRHGRTVLAMRNVTGHTVRVRWRASVSRGLRVRPQRGVMVARPGAQATTNVALSAARTTSRPSSVVFHLVGVDGRAFPPVVVRVGAGR